MTPLIQKLKQYGEISQQAEQELNRMTVTLRKKKYDHLLRQGQLLSSIFIIEKGIARIYLIREGKEINSWFCAENVLAGSILPLYGGKPSFENIEFLEDSIVHSISADDLNELYRTCPEMNVIGRKIAEELCIILEERITSLHTDNAEKRYRMLMEENPGLTQRVNLGHIASYLGITQETLSRIRRH